MTKFFRGQFVYRIDIDNHHPMQVDEVNGDMLTVRYLPNDQAFRIATSQVRDIREIEVSDFCESMEYQMTYNVPRLIQDVGDWPTIAAYQRLHAECCVISGMAIYAMQAAFRYHTQGEG